MYQLTVINICCSGDGDLDRYADFLRRKFDGQAQVKLFNLESPEDLAAVPPALVQQLLSQGVDSAPILALDGEVLAAGSLPNWIDSFELITTAMKERETTP